jgi:hypothetical protein
MLPTLAVLPTLALWEGSPVHSDLQVSAPTLAVIFRFWPAGEPQPLVSTLNSFAGKIVANAALVPAGVNGAISVSPSNPTDLIIDINGYFAP